MATLDSSKVRITVNDREIGTVTHCVLTPTQPNEMLIKSSFSMQMERLDAFLRDISSHIHTAVKRCSGMMRRGTWAQRARAALRARARK